MNYPMTNFAIDAIEVMNTSYQILLQHRGKNLDVEHLLLTILKPEKSAAITLLQQLNIDLNVLRDEVQQEIEKLPKLEPEAPDPVGVAISVYITPRLQRVFTNAERERQRVGQTETTSEHFLLAIAFEKEDNAAQLLARFGVTYDKLCQLTVTEVVTDEASEFLQEMEAQRGYVLDFHRIMAKYDLDFAKSYNGLLDAAYMKERLLDARTKEFIITTAIIVAASSEEHIVTHMKVLKRLGVTAEEALQFIEIILPPAGVPKFMNAVECWKKVWEITA